MIRIVSGRDFGSGVILAITSAIVLWQTQDLAQGHIANLGPGFVPRALGIMMAVVALVLVGRSLLVRAPALEPFAWRESVIVLISVVLFALTIERFGLLVASILLMCVSAFAIPDPRRLHSLAFFLVASVAIVGLFVWGLGIQVRPFPW
jgi:hypothetical protein